MHKLGFFEKIEASDEKLHPPKSLLYLQANYLKYLDLIQF